ncbi:MAG: hypothetical protein LIP01_00460 [Tannerellaceae bacterium]|nr:hypothetical protein [Tannerellaceae bacterium]
MKIKRQQFKLTAILIVIACFILGLSQGFWLKSLYKTMYAQTENVVYDAIRMADYKELFFRLDERKTQQKENGDSDATESRSFQFQYKHDNDLPEIEPADSEGRKSLLNKGVQIVIDFEEEVTDEENKIVNELPKYLSLIMSWGVS